MKKKLIIVGILLLIAALVGFLVIKMMYKKAERNVATEQAIAVKNNDLAKAYQSNEATANTLYLNKTIEVVGIISNIEKLENQTSITINTTDSLPKIIATFSTPQTFSLNDSVILKGICTGFLSNVLINDAVLLSTKKSIAPVLQLSTKDSVQKKITSIKNDSILLKEVFKTSKAQITFDAGGGVEDIKATNNQVEASIDVKGNISFKLAMLQFKFTDVLMQQHFNEEYVESTKFPTAKFVGKIMNINEVSLNKDGSYKATIKGQLTIHGKTKEVQALAQIAVKDKKIKATANIKIVLADYAVKSAAADEADLKIIATF